MEINKLPNRWGERLIQGLVILLPSYLIRFSVAGINFNLLDGFIVLAFSATVLRLRPGKLGGWKYIMGSFAIIGAIAIVVSSQPLAALGLYKSYIIAPMLVGYMVLMIRPRLEAVISATALLIGYITVVGAWQVLTGYGVPTPWNVPGDNFRITSIYEYPNAVGLLLAPLLVLLASHWLLRGKHMHWLLPVLLFGSLAIVWSRSAGAVVALFAGICFSLLFTKWRWWVIGFVAGVVIALLAFTTTREVLLFQDTSGEVRLALWQGTANLLIHHPITGAGLAGFPDLYAQYKLDRHVELLLYPHNLMLDFWVELGLLGVIWLLCVLVRFFCQLLQHKSLAGITVMSAMFAILVYGLVDVPYFKNDLAVLFWLWLTLADTITRPTNS